MKNNKEIESLKRKRLVGYFVMADVRLRKAQPIKNVEIILQEIIEKVYDGCWWEHINRNIFMDLIGGYARDLQDYIFNVLIPSLY